MKSCPTCKTDRVESDYYNNRSTKDGLQWECKLCIRRRQEKDRPIRTCSDCAQDWRPGPTDRHQTCRPCRQRRWKRPCPLCQRPMASSSTSCRDCMPRNGASNSNWRGGTTRHSHGYIQVTVPGRGYVMEHILLMEEHIGRRLTAKETVHHKNGVKCDNRLDNLELWASSHPAGQRITDLVTWAETILTTYGPLVAAERV